MNVLIRNPLLFQHFFPVIFDLLPVFQVLCGEIRLLVPRRILLQLPLEFRVLFSHIGAEPAGIPPCGAGYPAEQGVRQAESPSDRRRQAFL